MIFKIHISQSKQTRKMDGHSCQRTQSRSLSVSCLHPPHAPASSSVRSHPERPFRYSLSWLLLYTWQCIVQLKANHGKQWLSPFTASPRQKQASKVLALRKLLIWLVRQHNFGSPWASQESELGQEGWVSRAPISDKHMRGHRSPQGSHTWGREVHRTTGHQIRLHWGEKEDRHLKVQGPYVPQG